MFFWQRVSASANGINKVGTLSTIGAVFDSHKDIEGERLSSGSVLKASIEEGANDKLVRWSIGETFNDSGGYCEMKGEGQLGRSILVK